MVIYFIKGAIPIFKLGVCFILDVNGFYYSCCKEVGKKTWLNLV